METMTMNKYSKEELVEKGRLLVQACRNGDQKQVISLLKCGISPNATEYIKSLFYDLKNYFSPLHHACFLGHLQIVRYLLKCGADVNCTDRFNLTPLHLAAYCGNLWILKMLIEAGANCNVRTRPVRSEYTSMIPFEKDLTALHMATVNNHTDCVSELIINGADYNAQDMHGRTSLAIAVNLGLSECVMVHLRNNAKKDMLSLPNTCNGNTPLHDAILNNMNECVRELVVMGSDTDHRNDKRCTPLHYLLHRLPNDPEETHELIQQMIQNGFNVNLDRPDHSGYEPLYYLTSNHSTIENVPSTISLLVSYGANPRISAPFKCSLLEHELTKKEWDQNAVLTIMKALPRLPEVRSFKGRQFRGNFSKNYELTDERVQWYYSVVNGLKTLQHRCRLRIRGILRTKGLCQINTLHIPKHIQEYILLQK